MGIKILKPKNKKILIITITGELLKTFGMPDKRLTIRKLKSRKDTYRIWIHENFYGNIFKNI